MTIPASRRDELRRLVAETLTASGNPYWNLIFQLKNAAPDLLDEIERLDAEVVASDERMAAVLDGTFSVGDGTAQKEIERLRTELGEAKLVIEQQDRDHDRLRASLGEALDWWSPGELESSDARDVHDRLRKVLG